MTQTPLTSLRAEDELGTVYTISQILDRATHWKPALDKVVPLLRSIFIFDNLVLYLPDAVSQQLEVAYARVVGRGRSVGPDINWGEGIASQAFKTNQVVLQEPLADQFSHERLDQPYLLSVPLSWGDKALGAVVFIRFGGPAYHADNTRLAAFLGDSLAQLLTYKEMRQRISLLEAEQQQARLQDDFISTITHELLTPLGFIKGYTTTLLRQDATWDQKSQNEFLTIIDEETDRLQELLDNLLDSARLQSGTMHMQFQPVRPDVILRDVTMRTKQHNPGVVVELDAPNQTRAIQGDPRRLAQVLENLVGNALKYAPGSPISLSIIEEPDKAHIMVQDEGPGISKDYLPHLFERFFRVPEQSVNVRGTGLGLYVCRQIINAHHGEIYIRSKVGEGTIVHIELPYSQKTQHRFPETHKSIPEEGKRE